MSYPEAPRPTSKWGALEWFVLVQYLSASLLFLPGAQAFRPVIRALPYVSSLAMLAVLFRPAPGPVRLLAGASWLLAALALLPVGLFMPNANLVVGMVQIVFQVSIAAPAFWLNRFPCDLARVQRLVLLIVLANGASAVVGVLQAYEPDRFMPPEFTSLGLARDAHLVETMTYVADNGRAVIRPCGLTDMPGGAAVPGALCCLFGLATALRPRLPLLGRAACVFLAGMGLYCLYLTHVRSLLFMTVGSVAVLPFFLIRQGRRFEAAALTGAAAALTVGAFVLAVGFGGSVVQNRFLEPFEGGLANSYYANRGIFLDHTLRTLLFEYPLGAGAGRHGMVYVYTSRFEGMPQPPVHVEIQVTAWLLDGGVPMILLYGAAIAVALAAVLRVAWRGRSALSYNAALAFCAGLFIVGQSFAGPCFDTALGIQFWFLTAAVLTAARTQPVLRRARPGLIPAPATPAAVG